MQRIFSILWPAFLVACAAEFAFFALLDPADLHVFGAPLELPRPMVYTIGFFAFWAIGTVSSGLTLLLQRAPAAVNHSA